MASIAVVRNHLTPGMVFLDIGANNGQYTLLASDWVGHEGEVHSFEPSPTTFNWLLNNARLNRLENVCLNCSPISSARSTQHLYLSTPKDQGTTALRPQYNFSGRSIGVQSVSVDEYVADMGLTRVDFMKLDVEGAELDVLRGAQKTLNAYHPVLMVEFEEKRQRLFDSSCEKLAGFMTEHGYELRSVLDEGLVPYATEHTSAPTLNVLALPRAGNRCRFGESGGFDILRRKSLAGAGDEISATDKAA